MQGIFQVIKIPGEINPADIGTKNFSGQEIKNHKQMSKPTTSQLATAIEPTGTNFLQSSSCDFCSNHSSLAIWCYCFTLHPNLLTQNRISSNMELHMCSFIHWSIQDGLMTRIALPQLLILDSIDHPDIKIHLCAKFAVHQLETNSIKAFGQHLNVFVKDSEF